MTPLPIAADFATVEANIVSYHRGQTEDAGPIGYVRHWYAIWHGGEWTFCPGRHAIAASHVEVGSGNTWQDPRIAKSVLGKWFVPLNWRDERAAAIADALRRFMATKGKQMHPLAEIHVLKDQVPATSKPIPVHDAWRVTMEHGKLGGAPLIRGLRIGVADILSLLAHGATRQSILNDFPYLEDADITAALCFALSHLQTSQEKS